MSFSSSSSSSSPSSPSKESSIKGKKYYFFSSNVMLTLLFLMGSFLGYICWIVGVIFLILALRSGIRYIKYSRHWLDALCRADYFSTTVKGCVLEATKSIHPITHNITYTASFEYDNLVDDNNDNIESYKDYEIGKVTIPTTTNSNTTTKTTTAIQKQLTSYLDSQWLYEYQTHHAIIKQAGKAIFEVKVLDDQPNSGIPADLFYHKLADCTLWSKYVDPTIAIVGIHIYVIGCIIYSWVHTMENNSSADNGTSYQYWSLLILSLVIAPTLMIPYLLKEQAQKHQQRIQQLQTDPILLVSELDYMRRLWNAIGCTWTKKLHLFLFVIGSLQLLWITKYSLLLSILAFVAVWFGTLATGIIPIQRELLEKYRNHDKACTVDGQIIVIATNNNSIRREGERRRGRKNHEISIRYSMTTTNNIDAEEEDIDDESNLTSMVVTVEKQYLVKQELYEIFTKEESSSTTIRIRILNDYPCSGIPVDKLVDDIVSSWTMLGIQCIFWLSLLMYLFGCWSVLIDDDPYYYFWEMEDYLTWFCYIMIGPMLLVPQTSTWHCIQYQKLVDEYLFKGKIVKEGGGGGR